jgi:tetratricopeptide (TPR) repeat protein
MVATAWPAPPLAGKLVYLEGQVTVRAAGTQEWRQAKPEQELFAGDTVKTGSASRAAILCVDESQIKLNENTQVILKHIVPSRRLQPTEVVPVSVKEARPASTYEVPNGEIWLRNKNEKFRFELQTPIVNCTIRGTEFNLRVSPRGATVTLLDGSLCLVNPYGEVCLVPGEAGVVLPGQKPSKRVLVQPADAVQWCLYYPGIFSYRDLPFTAMAAPPPEGPPAITAALRQAEDYYNQGRLEEARQTAESVLHQAPRHSRALTLLGWISLQHFDPERAKTYFQQVSKPSEAALIGLALATYRAGEPVRAYELISSGARSLPQTPILATMTGYFALMVGKVDEARSLLEAVARKQPEATLARSLLAQIYVVQNQKEAARREASQALARAPNSPQAQLTMGLVEIASFQLEGAKRHLDKAIQADPRFIAAYLYLAKIYLGSEYLDRAQRTIDTALKLAPREAEVLSLAGFVRLAFRDYEGAKKFWREAGAADPGLGEPHLGLAIYAFRHRDFRQGLNEMLTATLLDPRVSMFQSELGKALYQTRSFDRALEVFDYAKTLDPKDPTPHFYKGVALTDLNRPGEAIQEINKSIELNDNVALFRSRSLLEQDLSLRNYNLARAYQQLGMSEWAFSKAVTAVKHAPTSSSAHLFLQDSYDAGGPFFLNAGELFSAREVERTLFRLLSPANQNTFSSLVLPGTENLGLTFDYTPMYEMPYARLVASGGIGAWEGKKSIQDHQAYFYGGLPGAAFFGSGRYINDRGFRASNDFFREYTLVGAVKWAPTVKGTFSGVVQYTDDRMGDRSNLNDFGYANDPNRRIAARLNAYELGYYHRFNPQVGFLAYYTHRKIPFHLGTRVPGLVFTQTFDREFDNVQFQQHVTLGNHSLIAGFDYFSSNVSQRIKLEPGIFNFDFQPPNWSYSFYLLDYWRLRPNLVVELGLFKDFSKDVVVGLLDYWRLRPNLVVELGLFKDFSKDVVVGAPGTVYNSMWSPRFGANYQFNVRNTQHTLRLALERHLTTHFTAQPLLIPSEIAGFTWALDALPGAEVRQAGFAWEAQWDPKTFTTLRLNALRVANPAFDDSLQEIRLQWKRYQASLVMNRILTPSLGLSAGVSGKRFVPDLSLQFTDNLQDYSEIDAFLGLSYLNRQGWLVGVKTFLVQQYLKDRADNPFALVNLRLGREFPNKRGLALFEVQNLFNRHFFYAIEPRRDIEFYPARRYMFRLAFYF